MSRVVQEVLRGAEQKPEAFQFFIWTPKLAKDRTDANSLLVPEIPPDAVKISIGTAELVAKRRALFAMRSQVNVWPYSDWQVQTNPILDKAFIDYFLRGEEIFVRVAAT